MSPDTMNAPALSAADLERFGADPQAMFGRNMAAVEEWIERACLSAGRSRA